MSLDERLGRLREPRFLLLYLALASLSTLAAGALYRVTDGALPELSGAVMVGGVALSAQVAKDRLRREPRRAWAPVVVGVLAGAVFGALLR